MLLFAHGIVGRADLPIPETLFGAAAAAVLVVSFVALALGWSQPRLERLPEKDLFVFPRALEVLLGALGLAVFLITVYAGIAGTDGQSENLAPTMVYVGFWVGVPFASLLLGNVFGVISPWRALGRGAGWVAARFARRAAGAARLPGAPRPHPGRGRALRLRDLRAVLGARDRARPAGDPDAPLLRRDARRDEPLRRRGRGRATRTRSASSSALIGSLAPLGRRADSGRLYLRVPVHRRGEAGAGPGTMALLVVSVGSTAFDGAKEGALFNDLAQDLQRFFHDLGFSLGLVARARPSWSGWRARCDRRGRSGRSAWPG